MWQWASISPGITVVPVASYTETAGSMSCGRALPDHTAAILPSTTRIVAFGSAASPLPRISVPPRISSAAFAMVPPPEAALHFDRVEPLRVVESHFAPLLRRKRPHDLRDLLVRARVRTGRVREIGTPQNAIHSDLVTQLLCERIVDDADHDVVVDVGRGLLPQRRQSREFLDPLHPIFQDR